MVVLFNWERPQKAEISFRRIGNAGIPPMEWTGSLNNESRWFNHQRLDAFYPEKNITWELTVGGRHWEITVEP